MIQDHNKAYWLKANGTIEVVEPNEGTNFTLDEMQKLVGGNIEIVQANDGRLLVVNEDGKNLNLPVNAKATEVYEFNQDDFIVGDAILAPGDMLE